MAEDDAIFDSSLMKKKKKKKTGFDLDAALGLEDGSTNKIEDTTAANNILNDGSGDPNAIGTLEVDDNLDIENFGKKKKKKKKPFNLDDLDNALPTNEQKMESGGPADGAQEEGNIEEDVDLDMDFSRSKKKEEEEEGFR